VRFIFDGQRVMEEHTPDDLGLENGDVCVFHSLFVLFVFADYDYEIDGN
jgi:hypothetical protein